jgi:hypothetical protein
VTFEYNWPELRDMVVSSSLDITAGYGVNDVGASPAEGSFDPNAVARH